MATAPRRKGSRAQRKTPRYEPVLELPPLLPEQYEALRDNIALHGVLVPILVDGDGAVRGVIDGSHRKQIADELGYDCPEVIKDDLAEQEKRTLARALNLARRQLDQASKRAIIADQLRETPGRSNRWIGKQLGVDDKTVAAVRVALLATAEIPQFDRTLGADNKSRPASLPDRPVEGDSRRKATYPFLPRGPDEAGPGPGSWRPGTVETPPGVARFLFDLIAPQYPTRTILDPCAGRGALTRPWTGREVVAYEIATGKDFFAGAGRIDCDLVLCNPPFSGEGEEDRRVSPPERFLGRILEVVPPGTPIALLAPMGFRLNVGKRSRRYRWLRDCCPPITTIISLPRDAFPGCEFHSEILLFGMPKLRPHYCLPDEYLP
jgi:type I restriction enzyme M protein